MSEWSPKMCMISKSLSNGHKMIARSLFDLMFLCEMHLPEMSSKRSIDPR